MQVDIKRYVQPMLFILALQATTFFCFAQKPKIGLKAGFLISNNKVDYTNRNTGYSSEAKKGGLFGLVADWPLSKNTFFRSGLEVVIKGSKERRRGSGIYGNYNYAISQPLTYLDVPVNLMYAANTGNGKFIIGAGPVIGILLSNSYTNYSLKEIDIGANVVTGYEWPIGFFVNITHVRGLKNISSDKQLVSDFKNFYYSLSLGYMF